MSGTKAQEVRLEPQRRNARAIEFESQLRARVVGQDAAVQALANLFQVVLAGLSSSGRPIGNFLFLGPTGTGKTKLVEAAGEILFGHPHAFVKIDCAEFQHSHEIAKLLGSPPGYLGHRETSPLLTQARLNQFHSEQLKLGFVLFDEIEKAHDAFWQLLLGILDKAELTIGDNSRTDFSHSVIFMTSNLGSGEMSRFLQGGIGFTSGVNMQSAEKIHQRVEQIAIDAAKRRFSPEFMNRIDHTVVFHSLTQENLRAVLELELGDVQQRIAASKQESQFKFSLTAQAKEFLLREGTSPEYGARYLKRAIERHLVFPLSNLISTDQVQAAEVLEVNLDHKKEVLVFTKKARYFSATS